jgi:DNA adenine methylase
MRSSTNLETLGGPASESQAALAPILKWAGGKRWQLPFLRPLWEPHRDRRLVEPFCGGCAVALGLAPKAALLNDVNPHVINFYRWVSRGLTIDLPLANEPDLYYRHRTRFNDLVASGGGESSEAAALFYYLNRTGYNGLCRFNRQGRFNVPFGRYKQIGYRRDFPEYREAMARWTLSQDEFDRVDLRPGDFVYADPPYDVEFTGYAPGGFGWAEQERTAAWLARHDGPVVLVNQATDRICDLYARLGYGLDYLDAPRRISCTGDRRPAREVVAVRNL